MVIVCIPTRFYVQVSNGLLVIAIKAANKYAFCAAAMLYIYILQTNNDLYKCCTSPKIPLSHNILRYSCKGNGPMGSKSISFDNHRCITAILNLIKIRSAISGKKHADTASSLCTM